MKKICLLLLIVGFPLAVYSSSLDEAYKDYLCGDYEKAINRASHLHSNDNVLYFLGLTYIKIGEFSKARGVLNKLTRGSARSEFYGKALVKLADTYFLERNFSKAKSLYNDMHEQRLCSDFMPLVYLRLAQIASKEGQWQDKKKYLKLLRTKYPDSSEIKFADVLENVGDAFFIQVGAFSSKSNALSLKKELQSNYPVYIKEEEKAGYTLYKVRIGNFLKRSKAEKIYSWLIKKGYPARIYP